VQRKPRVLSPVFNEFNIVPNLIDHKLLIFHDLYSRSACLWSRQQEIHVFTLSWIVTA